MGKCFASAKNTLNTITCKIVLKLMFSFKIYCLNITQLAFAIPGFFVANFNRTFYNLVLHLFFSHIIKYKFNKYSTWKIFKKEEKIKRDAKLNYKNFYQNLQQKILICYTWIRTFTNTNLFYKPISIKVWKTLRSKDYLKNN